MILMNVFMDNALSTLMSMTILIGGFVLLFFAYRSNADGKALIKKSIEKRNLFAEIILLIMALIEGVNAATYAVKEGRDFGASIAMHVFGGILSGVFAFGIYKQVMDVVIAVKGNKHPLIIGKEVIDVLGTLALAVAFPIINTYFVAIAAKHPLDFWNTFYFDWGRITSASVYYSTCLGMAHVFACFLLSLNSFDTTVFEATVDDGGVIVPLTIASDSEDDDAETTEDTGTKSDDEEDSTGHAPNQDIIPYSRIPDRANLLNFVEKNLNGKLGRGIDMDRLRHKMMVDDRFLDKVAVSIEDCLKECDKWDTEKAILQAAVIECEKKKGMMKRARQSYNFDADSRTIKGLQGEIEYLEGQIIITTQLAEDAEMVYNKALDNLGDILDIL